MYVPKKGRYVLLVSLIHHTSKIEFSGKPEIIEFYYSRKGGIDRLDQKVANYFITVKTWHWLMVISYAIIETASVNSYVLFTTKLINTSTETWFYHTVGIVTVQEPHFLKMGSVIGQAHQIRANIENRRDNEPNKRKRCHISPSTNDNKRSSVCSECNATVVKSTMS